MQAAYLRRLLCAGQGLCAPAASLAAREAVPLAAQMPGGSAQPAETLEERQAAWGSCAKLSSVEPQLVQRCLELSSLLAQKAASSFGRALSQGHWQLSPFMLSSAERQRYTLLD